VKNVPGDGEGVVAVYVDMGTTNTRVWLRSGIRTVARATELIGVRDSVHDDGKGIRKGLRELIAKVRQDSTEACDPKYIVSAGMISSNLGLIEVPHIQPPAGIGQLTAMAHWHYFPDVSDLPMLLVPGVRSGPAIATTDSVHQMDIMRGEETLCAGLVALEMLQPPAVVMNLGSHWKAIQLDREGGVQSSVTSLSGELLHAVQAHTVLASSVALDRPQRLSSEWVEAGMREQRQSGLGRALFCTRLLDLARRGTSEDRLAFVVGALIASDLDALLGRGVLRSGSGVVLVGYPAISAAWQTALSQTRILATVISQVQAETALLEALRRILTGALPSLESASQRAHRQ